MVLYIMVYYGFIHYDILQLIYKFYIIGKDILYIMIYYGLRYKFI